MSGPNGKSNANPKEGYTKVGPDWGDKVSFLDDFCGTNCPSADGRTLWKNQDWGISRAYNLSGNATEHG